MKLLHIDSSILGDNSASRQLSGEVVKAWQAAEPSVGRSYRDLASEGIEYPAATLVAAGTPAELRDAAQNYEAQLSADTLAQFLAADAVVIGAPMYNFTIPTQILLPGSTALRWPVRPSVTPKPFGWPVRRQESDRGLDLWRHSRGPGDRRGARRVFALLGFLGITDVEFVRAQGLGYGDEVRSKALSDAHQHIIIPYLRPATGEPVMNLRRTGRR